jgi:hypothetical protein
MKTLAAATLLAALMAVGAACGSDDEETEPAGSPAVTTDAPSATSGGSTVPGQDAD